MVICDHNIVHKGEAVEFEETVRVADKTIGVWIGRCGCLKRFCDYARRAYPSKRWLIASPLIGVFVSRLEAIGEVRKGRVAVSASYCKQTRIGCYLSGTGS